MAVAETKVVVGSLLTLGGAGVVMMFLCCLQLSKDLGLRKKQDSNTLSMPELSTCPTDLIPCPEMTPPEARATPGSERTERRGERRWNCHSVLHPCSHHSVLPRKLAALLLANVVDNLVYTVVLET